MFCHFMTNFLPCGNRPTNGDQRRARFFTDRLTRNAAARKTHLSSPLSSAAKILTLAGLVVGVVTSSVAETEASGWVLPEPIVSYWAGPMPITDHDAKQMSEGNWNVVPVTLRGMPANGDAAAYVVAQLDILNKYNIKGLLSVPLKLDTPEGRLEADAMIDAVKQHPAMYGFNIRDEPGVGMFPELKQMREYILARDPSQLVFVNLYPVTAGEDQLEIKGNQLEAYETYLNTYIKELKPQILSYDHYHFGANGDDGTKFFLNLALIRQKALEVNLPFMAIVQACSWTVNLRIPTGEELSWLTYVVLAYGGQGIAHYVYAYPGHDGGMAYLAATTGTEGDGTVVIGKPTPLYYYASRLNREFVAIAKELRPLHSLGVYHAGNIPEGTAALPASAPFRFEPPVTAKDFSPAKSPALTSTEEAQRFAEGGAHGARVEGFLLGYFGSGDKPTHVLLVNLDYRTLSGIGHDRIDEFSKGRQFGSVARRALVGPGNLEVFDSTSGKWTALASDRMQIDLPPGSGVLVRLAP